MLVGDSASYLLGSLRRIHPGELSVMVARI
jgi:hypothetical protein